MRSLIGERKSRSARSARTGALGTPGTLGALAALGALWAVSALAPADLVPGLVNGFSVGLQAQATGPIFPVPPAPGARRPVALKTPRVPPVSDGQMTDAHRAVLAKYKAGARPGNAIRTLATIPAMVDGLFPFQEYIAHQSSLPARQRELLILRTAWLLNNDVIWSEHAEAAKQAGMTAADLRRVAQGGAAPGWDPFEATLLRMADELFRNASITEATWKAVSAKLDLNGQLDAVMTVCDFTTAALLYNTFGIQPDAWFSERIPPDVPYTVAVPAREPALRKARIEPVPGTGLAIQRTFDRYPTLQKPRQTGANYVNSVSTLNPRLREIVILRTGWNAQAEYEWAQHVGSVGKAREKGLDPVKIAEGSLASGWSPLDRALLKAADELWTDSIISDNTWAGMGQTLDLTGRMNVTITAANYRMVSMALNALGVQIDPGDEGWPRRTGQ